MTEATVKQVPAEAPEVGKSVYHGRWYSCERYGCSKVFKTVLVRDLVPPNCLGCGQPAAEHEAYPLAYIPEIPIEWYARYEAEYDASFCGRKSEILAARRRTDPSP